MQLSATPSLSKSLSDTVGLPPPPPSPNTQPKGAGKGYEFPVKAPPTPAPATVRHVPPPEPHLIMRPQRSKASSVEPHRRRVMLFRSVCLQNFKMRAEHKVSATVWNWAENPTRTAISHLVESSDSTRHKVSSHNVQLGRDKHSMCRSFTSCWTNS